MSTVGTSGKSPTKPGVIAKLKEFERIGRSAFLKKYSSGYGARSHYIIYEEDARFRMSDVPPASSSGYTENPTENSQSDARCR